MNILSTNIIAGPCSVESHEQFFKTCDELRELGYTFFRGGVWKPRTKPGGFEGLGELALQWMKEYKELHPEVKMYCEVANTYQTKLAIKYGLDAIWIGARTTTDPFAVQEIADVLIGEWPGKENLIVMVKNPPCPDIDLWEGAIQRVKNSGIKNIVAIHRGFKLYNTTKYRNEPIWRIPLELKIKYPVIPILCDPSHISGNRDYIEEICNKAVHTYNFDGFIIESHCNPDEAWTDAKQQLKPVDLKALLDKVYSGEAIEDGNHKELDELRNKIDYIDRCLLYSLEDRLNISKKIGEYKKDHHMKTFQAQRWNSLLDNIINLGKEHGLDENYVKDIWEIIHEKSIEIQN